MNFPLRLLVLMTMAALILSIAMSVVSAWIRLSDAGLDCEPWPACFGTSIPIDESPGLAIAADDSNPGLRVAHRFMASAVGILIVLITTAALWYRKRLSVASKWPLFALGVTITLAVVGLRTPEINLPVVTTINLAGGMALAAILLHLRLELRQPSSRMPAEGVVTVVAILLTMLTIIGGAWVSANFAAGSCDGVFSCSLPGEANVSAAFNPGRELPLTDGDIARDRHSAVILYAHQASGPLLAFAIIFSCIVAMMVRGFRREQLTPLTLLVGLIILVAIEAGRPSAVTALLHNLLSLSLLLSLVWQLHQLRQS